MGGSDHIRARLIAFLTFTDGQIVLPESPISSSNARRLDICILGRQVQKEHFRRDNDMHLGPYILIHNTFQNGSPSQIYNEFDFLLKFVISIYKSSIHGLNLVR